MDQERNKLLDGLKIKDLKAAVSLDLLRRVRAKLKQHPHCHEVEDTARELVPWVSKHVSPTVDGK